MKNETPNYLISLIRKRDQTFNTRNTSTNLLLQSRLLQVFIFPCTVNEWFNLDVSIRNSESVSIFKSALLYAIRPVQNNIFNIFDPHRLELLTGLRLGFRHLNEQWFRHNFQEYVNSVCSCCLKIENTSHYLLHCHHFTLHLIDLMSMTNNSKIPTSVWWLTFWWKQK